MSFQKITWAQIVGLFSALPMVLLQPGLGNGASRIVYEEDASNFPNPDRGFFPVKALNASEFQSYRKSNAVSVAMVYYHLEPYRLVDKLPQSVFDDFNNDANEARKAGAKLIPRFIYNWDDCPNPPEAPLPRILQHLDQLGPTLRENSDVISHYQAGLIGLWGEWHHFGCKDGNNLDNAIAQRQVLNKFLEVVPDRSVAVRYPYALINIYANVPLGPDSAFNGGFKARTGSHNDSFRSGFEDRGTYHSDKVEVEKQFASLHNRYVPQSGETCGDISKYSGCDSALVDFKRMHWDAFSLGTKNCDRLQNSWKTGGCYPTIEKKLGYRLKMNNAILQDSVRPGFKFAAYLNLTNQGWGKIFNPRGCEFVLRNKVTKQKIIVKCPSDPRRWFLADTVANISLEAVIPTATPEGTYQVLLNLPDTAASIYHRPEYAIRLANLNVWEDSTGYNSLLHTVTVSQKASGIRNPDYRSNLGNLKGFRIVRGGTRLELYLPQLKARTLEFELFALDGTGLEHIQFAPNPSGSYSIPLKAGLKSQGLLQLRIQGDGESFGSYSVPNICQ